MLEGIAWRRYSATIRPMQSNSSPRRLAMLLTVALLIGIGVGVGCTSAVYWLLAAPSSESGDQLADVAARSAPTETESGTPVQSSPAEASNAPPKFAVRSLDEIAGMKSPSEQQLALRVLLTDLDEAQVTYLLTESWDVLDEADRYELQFAMIQRLAQQNPSRALSISLEMESDYNTGQFVASIFREWAHSNLDEAVSRARTLDQFLKSSAVRAIVAERTDLSEGTIRAIARDLGNEQIATSVIVQRKIEEAIDDPERAWNELAVDLQDDLSNSRTISRVAFAWVKESGLGVLDQVYRSLTNAQTRRYVISNVLGDVARTDPEGAFNHALTIESDPHNSIVTIIASTWADSDPRSALTAAMGIEKESVRKDVVESVIRSWAWDEPRAVLEGVNALPVEFQKFASTTALGNMADESPEEAAAIVAAMESGTVKTASANNVVSNWALSDPAAALEWILNEPSIEEIRTELLSSIMYFLVSADPELALSTALAQPIDEDESGIGMFGPAGVGMEYRVISTLVFTDVDKAIELLPQVREGPTKFMSFETVARFLMRNDEVDKAFNIVLQSPASDREKMYQALSSSWAMTDPKAMLESMDRFPSKDSKSRAAALLVTNDRYSKTLSDEEIEQARKYLTDEHAKAIEENDPEALESLLEDF